MSRLIIKGIVSGFMLVLSIPTHAEPERFCAQTVKVDIEHLLPPISFKGQDANRTDEIALSMPIDCEKGAYLLPSTLAQALDWLDKALPVDYKAGLLKGNTFLYSPYGSSVDENLTDFLQEQWRLTKYSPVCTEAMSLVLNEEERQRLMRDDDVIYCGPDVFNALKSKYLR